MTVVAVCRTFGAALLLGLTSVAVAGERTTADGVYTAEQAKSGQAVHEKYCAKCHHVSYYQGGFLMAWETLPVSTLYDLIEMKMPQDRPGSLKPAQYADLLAYVFQLNDLPAGEEELSSDHAEMGGIVIEQPK